MKHHTRGSSPERSALQTRTCPQLCNGQKSAKPDHAPIPCNACSSSTFPGKGMRMLRPVSVWLLSRIRTRCVDCMRSPAEFDNRLLVCVCCVHLSRLSAGVLDMASQSDRTSAPYGPARHIGRQKLDVIAQVATARWGAIEQSQITSKDADTSLRANTRYHSTDALPLATATNGR